MLPNPPLWCVVPQIVRGVVRHPWSHYKLPKILLRGGMGHSSQLSKCWVNVTRKTSSRDAVFKNAKLSLRAALLVKTWKRRLRLPYPTNRPPTATIGSLLVLRRRFDGGPVAGDRLVGMNWHFGISARVQPPESISQPVVRWAGKRRPMRPSPSTKRVQSLAVEMNP